MVVVCVAARGEPNDVAATLTALGYGGNHPAVVPEEASGGSSAMGLDQGGGEDAHPGRAEQGVVAKGWKRDAGGQVVNRSNGEQREALHPVTVRCAQVHVLEGRSDAARGNND